MLRPAILSDLPEILRIQAQCYHDIEPEQPAAYINKLEQAPDCAFVIECADAHQGAEQKLAAYLFALPIHIEEPPALDASDLIVPSTANCLYLHDLAIAPEGRGQGLSRPLLQAFFLCAKQHNLPQSSLIAIQNSATFWQKHGFRPTPLSTSAPIQAKLKNYGQAHYLIRH